MPDRLLQAIADIESKLNRLQKKNTYRRDWGQVVLAEWGWSEEEDFAFPKIQLSVATEDASGGPHGYEKAGDLHHYTEQVQLSVNIQPDVREDGTLDLVTPAQDFRADVHKALFATPGGRNRGVGLHMTTYYLGRRVRNFAEGPVPKGARVTEVIGLLWSHKTGNMEAGPGSA